MGAIVKGYALEPNTRPALFNEARVSERMKSEIGNIKNLEQLSKSMKSFNPDVLIHMASPTSSEIILCRSSRYLCN